MDVVKVISDSWGYTLKWIGDPIPSYITGKNGVFGWYRYKKDAQHAADVYNNNK